MGFKPSRLLAAMLLAAAVSACGKAPTSLPFVNTAPGSLGAVGQHVDNDDVNRQERLRQVSERLMMAAAPLCQGGGSACRPAVRLTSDSGLNAYANRNGVTVSRPLVDLAGTQDQLALVVAHEMAHLLLGHTRHGASAAIAQGDGAGGEERAADRLGLYLLARAGYQPRDAVALWPRLGAAQPMLMAGGAVHPGIAERHRAMLATCREIESKQRTGRPLIPGR